MIVDISTAGRGGGLSLYLNTTTSFRGWPRWFPALIRVLFYFISGATNQPSPLGCHSLTSQALAEAGGHFSQVSAPDILYSCAPTAPVPAVVEVIAGVWWWLQGAARSLQSRCNDDVLPRATWVHCGIAHTISVYYYCLVSATHQSDLGWQPWGAGTR